MAMYKTDFFARQRSLTQSIRMAYGSVFAALLGLLIFTQPVGTFAAGLALIGSWWKSRQLRQGLSYMPRALGAVLILDNQTQNSRNHSDEYLQPAEKQLINVVTEMALASQLPIPKLFLLREEPGINAFVVADKQQQGCLVLTQGALDLLARDELQALIAYQLGQIKTHDAHLHQRLLGIYYGLEMTGLFGYRIARSIAAISDIFEDTPIAAVLGTVAIVIANFILGAIVLPIVIFGFGGLVYTWLMRKLIVAGTTERADAHAVQFTRNPAALVSLLEKLAPTEKAANSEHFTGHIKHPKAIQVQYMCFAEARKSWFIRFKPSIADRLRALRATPQPSSNQTQTPVFAESPTAPATEPSAEPLTKQATKPSIAANTNIDTDPKTNINTTEPQTTVDAAKL